MELILLLRATLKKKRKEKKRTEKNGKERIMYVIILSFDMIVGAYIMQRLHTT
ncbi:hypothetical protein HYC85_003431 [Camellia sinensis]|uniref:Uncharacterized protein n=1 Tax=Camellia sinensis TaxID=4442 RepID=A0A7J7IBB7_CAMSI|nr:hypothetical protein HYC85_003431 [Camellia sinensis]